MATITKKAAKRISELLSEAATMRESMTACVNLPIWSFYELKHGLAIQALFDEFGIKIESYDTV